jgi:Ser/Thr protein kinase RdoA (MazF antagonist)
VFRLDGHVLKFYAKTAAFEKALAGLKVSSRVRSVHTPKFEGALPEILLTAQSYVTGSAVASPAGVAEEAGATLSALHRSRTAALAARTSRRQLELTARSAELVGWIAPDLQARVDSLLAALELATPSREPLVPSHGDFSPRQLVERPNGLFVTDFDAMCLAPPPLDLAAYAVRSVRGDAGELAEAQTVLEALLEGYGDVPGALDWYLATALLRRATHPFRFLDEHWRERVEGMIDAADAVAAR